jgi:hypothetical protein
MFPVFNKLKWTDLTRKAYNEEVKLPSVIQDVKKTLAEENESKDSTSSSLQTVPNKAKLLEKRASRTNYAVGSPAQRMEVALKYLKENPHSFVSDVALNHRLDRKALSQRHFGQLPVHAGLGRNPILSGTEEQTLVKHCIDMADLGYEYDVLQIRNLVRYFFKSHKITEGWWRGFQSRHPELTRRRTQALDRYRQNATTESNVQHSSFGSSKV